jgi:hypothetical protein
VEAQTHWMREESLLALRELLGIPEGEQDAVLTHCLGSCEALALDYCHLETLPERLWPVVVDMAVDRYRMSGYGRTDAPHGAVASLSEGEQSVSFADAAGLDPSGLLKGYAARLNAYRKLRWPKDGL